jgi:hypothetical protein
MRRLTLGTAALAFMGLAAPPGVRADHRWTDEQDA